MKCPYCDQDTISDSSTDDDRYPCMNPACFGDDFEADPDGLEYKLRHHYCWKEDLIQKLLKELHEQSIRKSV